MLKLGEGEEGWESQCASTMYVHTSLPGYELTASSSPAVMTCHYLSHIYIERSITCIRMYTLEQHHKFAFSYFLCRMQLLLST